MELIGKKITRAKHALSDVEGTALCHFDRREKSCSDPSHSLGMTGLVPSLCVSWRSFGEAQDMHGARKFLELVLSSISREASKLPPSTHGVCRTMSGFSDIRHLDFSREERFK